MLRPTEEGNLSKGPQRYMYQPTAHLRTTLRLIHGEEQFARPNDRGEELHLICGIAAVEQLPEWYDGCFGGTGRRFYHVCSIDEAPDSQRTAIPRPVCSWVSPPIRREEGPLVARLPLTIDSDVHPRIESIGPWTHLENHSLERAPLKEHGIGTDHLR